MLNRPTQHIIKADRARKHSHFVACYRLPSSLQIAKNAAIIIGSKCIKWETKSWVLQKMSLSMWLVNCLSLPPDHPSCVRELIWASFQSWVLVTESVVTESSLFTARKSHDYVCYAVNLSLLVRVSRWTEAFACRVRHVMTHFYWLSAISHQATTDMFIVFGGDYHVMLVTFGSTGCNRIEEFCKHTVVAFIRLGVPVYSLDDKVLKLPTSLYQLLSPNPSLTFPNTTKRCQIGRIKLDNTCHKLYTLPCLTFSSLHSSVFYSSECPFTSQISMPARIAAPVCAYTQAHIHTHSPGARH